MIAILRLFVVGLVVLTVIYLIARTYARSVRREALEQVITEALDRHICRCTGYVRYFEAVRDLILKTPGLVKA
mgnify:CR=1 FL=1